MSRATFIALVVVTAIFMAWAPTSLRAARVDFVGAARCSKCHEKQSQAWKKGPHSRAGESLGKQVGVAACQACHTTGDAPTGRAFFASVGCESCHGRGAGYSPRDVMRNPILARRLGLRDLSTVAARKSMCMTCHRSSTRLQPFAAEAAWKRIGH